MVLDEELRATADRVAKATAATELVGPNDDGRKARVRELAKFLHPDAWGTDATARAVAEEAFARLQALLAEDEDRAKAKAGVFRVTTRTRTYSVNGLAYSGTVANLYHCTYERDGKLKTGLLKLPRSVRDNDLMQAEAGALKKIHATKKRRTAYFPRLEDVFKHRDATTRIDRQAIVVRRLDGFVSLADVKNAYPGGLDPRDLAWIWRRGLAALSLLSELEVVHGALTPEHVLIHPVEHGVQLCGFTSSVAAGGTIKVLGGPKWAYAPEVLKKEEATVATDIYMFHKTMERLLSHDAPRQFFAFIRGVCFERPAVRPQDPRVLLGEYDELLERLYGPRKFRVFPPMPGVTT